MANVTIKASFGGAGIKKLQDLISDRMRYLGETANQSVAAVAINALKGVRTVTKVAKKSSIKVQVEPMAQMFPSFSSDGGRRRLCIRMKGSNRRHFGPETIVKSNDAPVSRQHVYKWVDVNRKTEKTYLIIAASSSEARNKAKAMCRKRALRYAGLAKRAIGMLMFKTNTKKVNDGPLDPIVSNKADEVTVKLETAAGRPDGAGGVYRLTLIDGLRYAMSAIKGGRATVDVQMKKAANKIVHIINQRLAKNGG